MVRELETELVAKKELERIPFFGTAWKAAGHISIDRSDRTSAIQSLRRAGRSIREQRSTVIIFPEGTRSLTGEMLPFKKGAFMLALEADVPQASVDARLSTLIRVALRVLASGVVPQVQGVAIFGIRPPQDDVHREQPRQRLEHDPIIPDREVVAVS